MDIKKILNWDMVSWILKSKKKRKPLKAKWNMMISAAAKNI